MKIVRAAAVLILFLPATASWAVSFEGSWATDKERCVKPDDGNIRIVSGSYFSHRSECAIRNIARRPLGYALALDCKSGSETVKKKIVVQSLAGGTKLSVDGTLLVRCQGGLQPPNYPSLDRATP